MTDEHHSDSAPDADEQHLQTLLAAPALPSSDAQFVSAVQKKLERKRARQKWWAPALATAATCAVLVAVGLPQSDVDGHAPTTTAPTTTAPAVVASAPTADIVGEDDNDVLFAFFDDSDVWPTDVDDIGDDTLATDVASIAEQLFADDTWSAGDDANAFAALHNLDALDDDDLIALDDAFDI